MESPVAKSVTSHPRVTSPSVMLLATVSQAPYCRGGVRHATGDRIAILLFELIRKPAKGVFAIGVDQSDKPFRGFLPRETTPRDPPQAAFIAKLLLRHCRQHIVQSNAGEAGG